ncbi:hypothetical protein LTI14_02170 [Nesterenkonia sp. YGD6]|uniref:hypothetical protein n=1 Tax=Nesterenkonia sp. YGD6 TaxID=2901231 RepID=UPI001F4CAE12|nr:hypothetical protein [Nesterenkonia sp. YGD6]MCH8562031.1 hypothetical protein [Nesterenkonia sp. YGD6]
MRRNALIAGLASLTLVLGACGGDSEDRARTIDPAASEAPNGESENSPDAEVGSGDLDVEAALLTLDDMPTGWTKDPDESSDDTDDDAALCELELLEDFGAVDTASADFSAGDFGPLLSHTVAVFDDDDAERGLEAFTEAFNTCDEWTEETEDGPLTFRPTPVSFPSFGDGTLAVRIDVESEMVDMTMDMITWRQANTLSLIAVMEVFGAPDGEQTEEFVTVADERLASLL